MNTRVVMHKGTQKEIRFLPRYDPFKEHILAVSKSGYDIDEIAGNGADMPILLSVVSNDAKQIETKHCLLESPILSQPGYYRCLFESSIGNLASTLRNGDYGVYSDFLPPDKTVKLEHVFDY